MKIHTFIKDSKGMERNEREALEKRNRKENGQQEQTERPVGADESPTEEIKKKKKKTQKKMDAPQV